MTASGDPLAEEHLVRVSDGLRLFVRDLRPRNAPSAPPLVCLPGLTRDGRDFDALARHVATQDTSPRRVVAIDFRGRGRSDHDPDASSYNVLRETQDVLEILDALEIGRAVFVGTSRGGLVAMQLGAIRPDLVAGAVLNDIGPVLGISGLRRIGAALETTRTPTDWDDAARRLRDAYGMEFPAMGEADWAAAARRTYVDRDGSPVATYDERLAAPLRNLGEETELPALWPQFDKLAAAGPILVLRGENSELLTPATLDAMLARHACVRGVIVPGVGHPPPLATPIELRAVGEFLEEIGSA